MLYPVNHISWEVSNLDSIVKTIFQEYPLVQEALVFRISIANDQEKHEFLNRYSDINKAISLGKISQDIERTLCESIQKNHEIFCLQYYGDLLKNTQDSLEQHEKTTAGEVLSALDF